MRLKRQHHALYMVYLFRQGITLKTAIMLLKDERGLSEILRGDLLIYRTTLRIQVAVTEFPWKILSPLRVLGSVMTSVT